MPKRFTILLIAAAFAITVAVLALVKLAGNPRDNLTEMRYEYLRLVHGYGEMDIQHLKNREAGNR